MNTVNASFLLGFRCDSAAIASMLPFAGWSGLYKFCKKCEQGRRIVRETFEKDISRLL